MCLGLSARGRLIRIVWYSFGIFWKCSLKYFEIFWAPRCVWASLRGAVCDRIVWYSFGIFCKCSLKYFEIFWVPRCVWASLRGAAAPCGRNEAPGVEPAHYLSLKIQIHQIQIHYHLLSIKIQIHPTIYI